MKELSPNTNKEHPIGNGKHYFDFKRKFLESLLAQFGAGRIVGYKDVRMRMGARFSLRKAEIMELIYEFRDAGLLETHRHGIIIKEAGHG